MTPAQEDQPRPPDSDDGIVIRELATLAEYQACCTLQDETWGEGFSERVPAAILRVSQKIGGVTAGAFDREGRMMGFVFGMTGVRDGVLAHWSDMLAVRPEARGHGLGERLKQYQRERVLAIGVEVMYWTFDPLVARNAHFNINRLGARPVEYVADMYGSNTGSMLHGDLPTDRLVVAWRLRTDCPAPEGADRPLSGDDCLPLADPVDEHGVPRTARSRAWPEASVQVPVDPPAGRVPPAEALAWRLAVRDAMRPLMEGGYRVTRFVRSPDGRALPYYVLRRPAAASGTGPSPGPSPSPS